MASYPTPMIQADRLLAALAVLGQADTTALAALLEHTGRIDELEHRLMALTRQGVIRQPTGLWRLEPGVAATLLTTLERDDLLVFRQLHERAVRYLGDQLRAGNQRAENAFTTVLERLANRLMSDDPARLIQLMSDVRDVPLAIAAHGQLRRYLEAVALARADRYSAALAALKTLLAEPQLDQHVRGRALNSRAIYCELTGRLEEALTGYRESLAYWQQLGNREREGVALLNLGGLAYTLHQYEEAEQYLTQAGQCFSQTDSRQWLGAVQNQLGLVYRDQGRWGEALACLEAAAAQYRAAPDFWGRVMNNVGEVMLFQNRLQESIAAFQQALAAMSTRAYAVDVYLNLGLVHQARDRLAEAKSAYQAALDLALEIDRRDILAEAHYRLGECLRRSGEAEAALAQFEAAVAVIEETREPLRDEGLKISLLGRWQQVYEALVLHYLSLGQTVQAFEWAERARARAFADLVTSFAARASQAETDRASPATQGLAEVATLAEVQARLPPDATLLCYFSTGVLDRDLPLLRAIPADNPLRRHLLTPARTLLFVLTRDGLAVHDCPLDPNALSSASLRRNDRRRFWSGRVLSRLYAALLAPAGEALAAGRVYVAPHGPLHYVPFGALLDENNQPLVRPAGPRLAYVPSATVLLRHCLSGDERAVAPAACLAIGYDGASGEQTLPHTEAEAKFVAGITGGEAWIGPSPKKGRLEAALRQPRWLHFACHSQFNHASPLESWLETGAGERLTAAEVLRNWRLQADLVVLSACQTGLSRLLRGDEPMGLIRAFLAAGAKTVLAAQWRVEDLPTFLLMQRFYSALQAMARPDPAIALQTAQVWLRELTAAHLQTLLIDLSKAGLIQNQSIVGLDLPADRCPFDHPRYWAAFTLIGA